MKICYISNPGNIHTYRWVSWFSRRGHDISLICDAPLVQPERYAGIRCYNLPGRMNLHVFKYLAWIPWVRAILKQTRPEILHAHRVTGAGWLGAFSGYHPLVLTPWGSDLYRYPQHSPLARWLTHYVMGKADAITADSKDLYNQAIYYGAKPQQWAIVQWGVDLQAFQPTTDRQAIRRQFGITGDPVILSPRSVKRVYNLHVILEAIPLVRRELPDATFIFREYNSDPVYKSSLLQSIKTLDLERAIHWIGEVEYPGEIANLYQASDVVVSVAEVDGTPVSVLEAMACGVPVIASDLPSLREWITPGENGLLVSASDPQSLAQAIIQLSKDKDLQEKFHRESLAIIRVRGDHEKEMSKMETIYQDIIRDFQER